MLQRIGEAAGKMESTLNQITTDHRDAAAGKAVTPTGNGKTVNVKGKYDDDSDSD